MSKRYEYSIITQLDPDGDDTQFVFRQTVMPAGIVVAEEIARLDYGDVRYTKFPDGLIEPTEEERALYGGTSGHAEDQLDATVDMIDVDMAQVELNITDFVVNALLKGRQPILAWNDLANETEIKAFQNALGNVNKTHGMEVTTQVESIEEPEQFYGLYL